MGATTRRQIAASNLDQPDTSGAGGRFSQLKLDRLIDAHEPDCHRPVIPNDLIRGGFGIGDLSW